MTNIAVLDDYQGVSQQLTDWSVLPDGCRLQVFRDHLNELDTVAARLQEFDVVCAMRERTPFPRELLERLPNLKLLVTAGMRNASIDTEAATDHGVLVCGTDGGPTNPPAELTWGLILALARHIHQEDAATRNGHWGTTLGPSLEGKVLGVLGLGRLGAAVAKVGVAFEMSVIAWSQNLTQERAAQHGTTLVSKEELFRQSDVVSVHVQLSERTVGLVGARELGLMKPTALLINTARGPIVDEAALIDALRNGTIAGAGLDVFDQEPLPADHPFLQMDNTLLTPHLGYATPEQLKVRYQGTVEDIGAFLEGSPIRALNPEALETARDR